MTDAPDNSPRAWTRRLRHAHRSVRRCKHCGRVLCRLDWCGVGPPSHVPLAWRLWRPMEEGEPCARERWRNKSRTEAWRRRVRRVAGRLATAAKPGRFVRLQLERAIARGATIPEGLPEKPKYLVPGPHDRRLPL